MEIRLEVCVDSVDSAMAAERGGAHRVELCSDLLQGGITPSAGLISAVRSKVVFGVFVIIRPRGGDFFYSSDEFEIMQQDIRTAKQLGADGLVLGLLTQDGDVDVERTKTLVELASPLPVTFHRAFDMSRDLVASLDQVVLTGASRVLTSGGEQTADEGLQCIKELNQIAAGRVTMVAGSGIRESNVSRIVRETGVQEIHASLGSRRASSMNYQNDGVSLGVAKGREYERMIVVEENVRSLLAAARREKPAQQGI